jgi:uncharacterized membrane protein YfcA
VEGKAAAAISLVSKSLTCGFGLVGYFLHSATPTPSIFLPMLAGSFVGMPIATHFAARAQDQRIRFAMGLLTIALGGMVLWKASV